MSAQIHNEEFVFEIDTLFCSRSKCVLHVRPGDPGIVGAGNWATVNGITVGRRLVNDHMLCDFCAARADAPPE